MREFLEIAKALSDPNRVRILLSLRDRELCVCQITEFLELAPSTVSKHMSILDHARLVESRKDGRWVYYRLADNGSPAAAQALAWMDDTLRTDPVALLDEKRLQQILSRGCTSKVITKERMN